MKSSLSELGLGDINTKWWNFYIGICFVLLLVRNVEKEKEERLVPKTLQCINSPGLNVHASASFPSTTGEKDIKLSCALTTAVETGAKKTESLLFSLLTGESSRENAAN